MRSRYLCAILGLSCLSTVSYADDSIVNLSVLDNLSADTMPSPAAIAPQGPLFPVIYPDDADNQTVSQKKKVTKKKAVKAKKNKNIKKQAPKKKAVVKKAVKEEVKVPQILPADSLDAQKTTEVKVQDLETKVIEMPQKPQIEYKAPALDKKEELTVKQIVQPEPQSLEQNALENKNPMQAESLLKDNQTEAKVSPIPQKAEVKEPSLEEQNTKPEVNNVQTPAMENKPSLLVDNKAENQNNADSVEVKNAEDIYFEAEAEELTDEQKAQLDKLVASFENPKENKIAIYAYNYVNGEDAFRRKRMALNRAVNIRSYLLLKGYKNYSMKVINIEEADGKENCVHVEELK